MNISKKNIALGAVAILSIATVTLLATHFLAKSAATDAVLERLKDPESAIFGAYTRIGGEACLTVNAKNAMGGYVGQQQALLEKSNGDWTVSSFEEISHSQCVSDLKEREAASADMLLLCQTNDKLIKLYRESNKSTAELEATNKRLGCK